MIRYCYTTLNNISEKDVPLNTEELVLHDDFNKLIYSLPLSIKFIKFGKLFDKPIVNFPNEKTKCYLHDDIISIKFGEHYNQNSDNLPKNLQSLTFGWFFDKPIINLPKNLEYLEFGFNFNQELNNLPKNLKFLTLGFKFDKSINVIPETIRHLTIFNNNDKLLNNIPYFIQELEINDKITTKKIENLPSCLQKILIRNSNKKSKYKIDKLPFGCEIVYL